LPARTPSRILTPQEANDQYGIPGHLKFDADTPEPIAQELKTLKTREVERQDTMRRAQAGLGTALTAGLVASILDPLNVASAFIPVVGEARYAAMVARLGVTGARATRGAIEGAVGAAIVEPFTLAAASYEQADYDAADSLASIAFGTALGSGLHVAGGAVKDRFVTAVDNLPAADKEALLRTSVAQVAEGRPVEVGDLLRQRLLGNVGEPLDKVFDDLLPPELRILRTAEAASTDVDGGKLSVVGKDGKPREFLVSKSDDGTTVYQSADLRSQFEIREFGDRVQVVNSTLAPEDRAQGIGTQLYERAARAALSAGKKFVSDDSVSESALAIYRRLQKAGFTVVYNPDVKHVDPPKFTAEMGLRNQGDKQIVSDYSRVPVASVEALPVTANDGPAIELRSKVEIARAQATEALRVKLAEAAAGPRIKMEPEGERFLADIERRFSEVQARPEAIADELKAVEAEMVELDRLLPADSEAKATTPAMQEANVYAKAWEEAVACRIRKA
jgi:GNAT superfamily N-acetyltransferase